MTELRFLAVLFEENFIRVKLRRLERARRLFALVG